MINTFLTISDIAYLQAIKAQNLNANDFKELSKFLKSINKEIKADTSENLNNVWNYIYKKYSNSILGNDLYIQYKDSHPNHGYGNTIKALPNGEIIESNGEKLFAVEYCLESLDKRLSNIYNIACGMALKPLIAEINKITFDILNNDSFDTISFIVNDSFDFTPYTIDSLDAELIKNTLAIDKAVKDFFDQFTKNLSPDQKTILSKNFLQTITFFIENSTPAIIKDKGKGFKKLVDYTYSQK